MEDNELRYRLDDIERHMYWWGGMLISFIGLSIYYITNDDYYLFGMIIVFTVTMILTKIRKLWFKKEEMKAYDCNAS